MQGKKKTRMEKGRLAGNIGKLCEKHVRPPLGLMEQEEDVNVLVSPRVQGGGWRGGSSGF